MRRTVGLVLILVLLSGAVLIREARASGVGITFENVAPGEVIVLPVGESFEFKARVEADEPFIYALMLSDEQFPGRGIFLNGSDIVNQSDSADLQLTATGKNSTAQLPGGVAPVGLVVGVRYPGGVVFAERVDFYVQVP